MNFFLVYSSPPLKFFFLASEEDKRYDARLPLFAWTLDVLFMSGISGSDLFSLSYGPHFLEPFPLFVFLLIGFL